MTVKELIQELLDYDMESEVSLRIKLYDTDLDYQTFNIEAETLGGGWGRKVATLSVDLENKTSEAFAEEVKAL